MLFEGALDYHKGTSSFIMLLKHIFGKFQNAWKIYISKIYLRLKSNKRFITLHGHFIFQGFEDAASFH